MWVIAETTDLPTKFAKMVVTDDQGRYVLPELAEGELQGLGARLRPGQFAQGRQRARENPQPDRGDRAERGGGGGVLPRDLLVLDAARCPGQQRVPRHRPERQRHFATVDQEPVHVARRHQDRRLRRLPPARQQGDAHDRAGVQQISTSPIRPGCGASSPDRRATAMASARRPARHAARAEEFRGLDRPDRRRRIAEVEARAPAGRRAQHRRHACGIGALPRCTCTTRSPPTGAIRRSMPTARSTARPNGARITCRCSIRSTTAPSIKLSVRDPKTPSSVDDPIFGASRLLGRASRSGTARPRRTIR